VNTFIEATEEGIDPFADAECAIRVVFEAWYDPEEDEFPHSTYFLRSEGVPRDECPFFSRNHKRHIGFLIYRDFRGLARPITLDPAHLFSRLLRSQGVTLKEYDQVLDDLGTVLRPVNFNPEVASILNAYKAEIERFLSLSAKTPSALSFGVTDRTRREAKRASELYVRDQIELPLQKMGAGTRSLAILAMLTLIMRRRGRGILPDLIGELQTARRECDRDRLRITAHQLHGTAANYGFPEVSEIASTYEQAMREERGFPECDDVLDRLVDMLRACGSKAAGGSKTSVDALG
jgi:HPt (histidine-containing phosphotransfer) domain-containing protein